MDEQSDEYTLEDEVGQGLLGTVFRGRAPGGAGYERIVAIKHLRTEAASDDAFVSTLAAQAGRLMGRPRPHVEGIVDVVQFGSDCYLVVDWIEGPSLKQWVSAYHHLGKPAPVGQLLAIAQQILFALHSLHQRGLHHGGLSTGAIRLDRLGHPMLTRVGIRSALDASLAENRWANDGLRLVPPEGGLSVAADVFGMGLTLYTVLAGAAELKDLPDDLRVRLLAGKPVDLDPIRQDVPAVVLRTIERALARDPAERFESAAAMARSMDFILRSLPEMTDSVALSHSMAEVMPASGPPKTKTPAKPPRAPALRAENTDQLDLADLRALRIDQE